MAFTAPRKTIVLPTSQESVVIRKLTPADFQDGAKVPDLLRDIRKRKLKGEEIQPEELEAADADSQAYLYRSALTAVMPTPGQPRLVYKKPDEITDEAKEFSFFDLDGADQEFLCNEVWAFTQEGAAQARTFPPPQA